MIWQCSVMKKGRRELRVLSSLCFCFIALLSCQSKSPLRRFTYGYLPLWADAQQRCIADYPKESIAGHHQGIAVAELEIGRDGVPLDVKMLQSPDAPIERSVRQCAGKWRMKPGEAGGPDIRAGKLYFYFLISPEGGKVYLANDPADKKTLVALRL